MEVKIADKRLIEINHIKNIKSIAYRDLYVPNGRKDTIIAPGFIVEYGSPSKVIQMTSYDEYFDEFVRKIKDVYLDEKDKVLDVFLGQKKYIDIDPLSKVMLLEGNLEDIGNIYGQYVDAQSYDESLLMEEDRFKAFWPLIQYHLKEFLLLFDKSITNIKLSNGINGIYHLNAKINNVDTILPIYYEEYNNTFNIQIGNLFDKCLPLIIKAELDKNGIVVDCKITDPEDDWELSDYYTYKVRNDKIYSVRNATTSEKTIKFETKYLDMVIPKSSSELGDEDLETKKIKESIDIYEFDSKSKNINWFKLPWDSYIGLKEEKVYINDNYEITTEECEQRIVENRIIYLCPTNDTFYLNEFANKRFHKKITDTTIGGNVTLDSMQKTRIGLKVEGKYLVETYFGDNGLSTGKYSQTLLDNYFYHIYKNKDVYILLDREDGLEDKSDLINVNKYI